MENNMSETEKCMLAMEAKIKQLQVAIKEKDELIFAYDATQTPVLDTTILDLRAEIKQLQHDLDLEKSKSAGYLSALAYCLDRTEMLCVCLNPIVTGSDIHESQRFASEAKGHIETLGWRYEIMWDNVKR